MRSTLILIAIMGLAFAKAYSQQPINTDSTTVEKSVSEPVHEKQMPDEAVKEFFRYFHIKDTLAMRNMMVEGASLNTLIISASKGKRIQSSSINEFLKGIAQIPDSLSFEERLIQIKVTNSVDIATVNTMYEFYMNDGFTHNGVNVFTMVYIDDKWKITSIADTRQYP